MRSFFGKRGAQVAFGACVCLGVGCGSSTATNFYDTASGGPGLTSGGSAPMSGGSGPMSGGSAPMSGGSGPMTGGAEAGGSTGGSSAAAGTSGVGTSGSFGNAGQSATGGGAGNPGNPNAPCSPAKDLSVSPSGPFGSVAGACFRVTGDITGWGCSNFEGRTVKVNRQPVTCGELPLPDKFDGAYYFDISAGMYDYASLYWY